MPDFFGNPGADEKLQPPSTHEERVGQLLDKMGAEPADITDPEEASAALDYKMLCDELLAEFYAADSNSKAAASVRTSSRKNILELLKERRGAIPFTNYTLVAKDKKGGVTFDWEKYVEDVNGPEALKEIKDALQEVKDGKADYKYAKIGKGSIDITVMKNEEGK